MDFRKIPYKLWSLPIRYVVRSAGVGMWTTQKDKDGWYYSFFLRPAGKGARSNRPEYYQYVERMTSKRRSRKACQVRSTNLAEGKNATAGIKGPASHTLPGTGYCVKEKKTVFVNFTEEIEAKNGRMMIRGNCADCGTKIQKYGILVLCANCGKRAEGKPDDYLCVACRAEDS